MKCCRGCGACWKSWRARRLARAVRQSACDRLYSREDICMKNPVAVLVLLLLCVPMAKLAPAQNSAKQSSASSATPDAHFDKLVDEYFDDYFSFHPSQGTAEGFHQYDSKLEDYSRPAIEREIESAKSFQQKFAAVQ